MREVQEYLTLGRAFEILQPPLLFGNPKQIAAVRFIERVDEARELADKCELCDGQPVKIIDGNDYSVCHCVDRFSYDVLEEAFKVKLEEAA
jgi:hypothetical protein